MPDRVITLSEGQETRLVAFMRDVDDFVAVAADQYPGHTWTRSEILQMFFHDLMVDQLQTLIDARE